MVGKEKELKHIENSNLNINVSNIRGYVNMAIVHIKISMTNTIVTITAPNGDTIVQSSSGSAGFKGSKRKTGVAAKMAGIKASQLLSSKKLIFGKRNQIKSLVVFVKGIGKGRGDAIKGLVSEGYKIKRIFDITPIPHNGCRAPKRRRL
jgi:small subunit ribosomal protein S11